ncbi:MAG: cache domain-containing protein [Alphaproteobacteria bacterium]|nr:cache domain-containing protein [Alphaproteobacteria bacterium]
MCVWPVVGAGASELDGVRALAREKAAAVGLMRAKAANILTAVSQDRLFAAYLNATTQGEGARVRTRIEHALATFIHRYGFNSFQLIDRSGAVVTYVSTAKAAAVAQVDVVKDRGLASGFAQQKMGVVSTVMRPAGGTEWDMSIVAPISLRGQTEFVLRAEQDGAAFQRVLALGSDAKRYILLLDEHDQLLYDSRPLKSATPLAIAGQSPAALRRALGGKGAEGSGLVGRPNEKFNVSYYKTGDWTVIAVEPVLPPRRCTKDGDRLCG